MNKNYRLYNSFSLSYSTLKEIVRRNAMEGISRNHAAWMLVDSDALKEKKCLYKNISEK